MITQSLRPTSEIKPRCYELHQLLASTIKGTLFLLYTSRMLCIRRQTIALFNTEWVITLHWVCMDLQLLHCRVAFFNRDATCRSGVLETYCQVMPTNTSLHHPRRWWSRALSVTSVFPLPGWMVIGAVLFMPAEQIPCSDLLSRFAVCWPVGVC